MNFNYCTAAALYFYPRNMTCFWNIIVNALYKDDDDDNNYYYYYYYYYYY
jgi:hypothetical protein